MCVPLRACFAKEVLRAEVRETRKGECRVFAHQQGCGDTAFRVIFVAPFLVDERGGVERSANVMDAPQAQGGRRTDIRRHRHTHSQAHARTHASAAVGRVEHFSILLALSLSVAFGTLFFRLRVCAGIRWMLPHTLSR